MLVILLEHFCPHLSLVIPLDQLGHHFLLEAFALCTGPREVPSWGPCPLSFVTLPHNFQCVHPCHSLENSSKEGPLLSVLVIACVPHTLPSLQSLSNKYS